MGNLEIQHGGLNTFSPSQSPSLSYQFRSVPALSAIPNIPNAGHSASSFISRLASNLSSLCSEIHHLSFFFFFSFVKPSLPCFELLSVIFPLCATALYLTLLFCHPYPWPLTPLLIFLIRQEPASPRRPVFPRCRLSGGASH